MPEPVRLMDAIDSYIGKALAERHARGLPPLTSDLIIKGDQVDQHDVQPAPWAPTAGSWDDSKRWTWRCPSCGLEWSAPAAAPSVACTVSSHPARTGLRPATRPPAAPGELLQELLAAGVVERLDLLTGALELVRREAGGQALEDAAAALAIVPDDRSVRLSQLRGVLLERAELHRSGEL